MRVAIHTPSTRDHFICAIEAIFNIFNQLQPKFFDLIGHLEWLQLFDHTPMRCSLHNYKEKEQNAMAKMLSVHKYCYNNHYISNVDVFFSMDNSISSNFMGKGFNSLNCVGFKQGSLKDALLTHKVAWDPTQDKGLQYNNLLKNYEKDSKKLEALPFRFEGPIDENWRDDPYICVFSDSFLGDTGKWHPKWVTTFSALEGQRFFLLGEEPLLSEDHVIELSGNNRYTLIDDCSLPNVGNLIKYCAGAICDDEGMVRFGEYFQIPVASFAKPITSWEMSNTPVFELDGEGKNAADLYAFFDLA